MANRSKSCINWQQKLHESRYSVMSKTQTAAGLDRRITPLGSTSSLKNRFLPTSTTIYRPIHQQEDRGVFLGRTDRLAEVLHRFHWQLIIDFLDHVAGL